MHCLLTLLSWPDARCGLERAKVVLAACSLVIACVVDITFDCLTAMQTVTKNSRHDITSVRFCNLLQDTVTLSLNHQDSF